MILCYNIYIAKIGSKVGNKIEDLLEEGIAMPVKKWHLGVSCIIPLCLLCAVDDPDELHHILMEDGWRAVGGGYPCDDQIYVDAKAGKINNGYHGANVGDGSLCLGLVHVEDIHVLDSEELHTLSSELLAIKENNLNSPRGRFSKREVFM